MDTINGFEDFTVKQNNDVYGKSMINHAKRLNMKLSMKEYVVADFIDYCNSKSKQITFEYVWRKLAMERDEFMEVIRVLIRKDFVIQTDKSGLKVTRKWLDNFMVEDSWFDAFWNVNNKPWWTGSKKDAKSKFVRACKEYSPEFIISCRDHYIRFLNHPSNSYRPPMAAAVFLGMENERFKEDWSGQLKRLNGNIKMPASLGTPLDKQGKEELFK